MSPPVSMQSTSTQSCLEAQTSITAPQFESMRKAERSDDRSEDTDHSIADSGYASVEPSPSDPEGVPQGQRFIRMECNSLTRKLFSPRKTIKLKSYNRNISSQYLVFFADLKELLVPAIQRRVFQAIGANQYGPCTINLRVLGTDEGSAKPWIVVLCDPRIANKMRRLFNEDWVKSMCQPGPAWPDLDCLQTIVHPSAPLLQAAHVVAGVFGDSSAAYAFGNELSSRTVQIRQSIVTIGGAVTVICDNEVHYMGLTVGHGLSCAKSPDLMCTRTKEAADSISEVDESSAAGEDVAVDEDEIFELDLEDMVDSIPETAETADRAKPSWRILERRIAVGDLVEFRKDNRIISSKRRLDWALIRPHSLGHSANDVNVRRTPIRDPGWLHLWNNSSDYQESADTIACLLSGMRGQVFGSLVFGVSVFSTGARYDFTTVHLLRPTNLINRSTSSAGYASNTKMGPGLLPGECGSWVVDSSTGYVFGHAVASDVFGDIYVIPMDKILDDIKTTLDASLVCLSDPYVGFDAHASIVRTSGKFSKNEHPSVSEEPLLTNRQASEERLQLHVDYSSMSQPYIAPLLSKRRKLAVGTLSGHGKEELDGGSRPDDFTLSAGKDWASITAQEKVSLENDQRAHGTPGSVRSGDEMRHQRCTDADKEQFSAPLFDKPPKPVPLTAAPITVTPDMFASTTLSPVNYVANVAQNSNPFNPFSPSIRMDFPSTDSGYCSAHVTPNAASCINSDKPGEGVESMEANHRTLVKAPKQHRRRPKDH